ncbi:MAG: PIN domain-containing protein [Deferrisomatales bacterium]|nr:PIN domain-containing protein [Deferrisomatales bacterium]
MSANCFVDSNILIYAHDTEAGRKREVARLSLQELWETNSGVLSTQVLQEFYVNVTRKIPRPLDRSTARDIVHQYRAWPVVAIDPEMICRASELEERCQLSFWDAMIVTAARTSRADMLLTEDLNPGQMIDGVRVHNPFLD